MLNDAQMAKLRKKVSKEVSVKFEKREKEAKEKQNRVLNLVNLIEKEHPNRGKAYCLWQGFVYYSNGEKLIALPGVRPQDVKSAMKLVEIEGKGTSEEKSFYMYDEKVFKENEDIMKWLSENYAFIKMYMAQVKSGENSKDRLVSALGLGDVAEKFQERFPNKSLLDLVEWIKAYDFFIMQSLNEFPKG